MHSIDVGLLALRLVAGGLLLGHGLAKFGFLRGFGLDGSAAISAAASSSPIVAATGPAGPT